MYDLKRLLLFFSLFYPLFLYANCPKPSEVTYGCTVIFGKKHCNWGAPWYEGFPEDSAKNNDKAAFFEKVFWGSKNNPPQPSDIGSTVCMYISPYGNIIKLVQNRWGEVPYPHEKVWKDGYWEGYPGRECYEGIARCHFPYPLL